jgi:hypothetical protein
MHEWSCLQYGDRILFLILNKMVYYSANPFQNYSSRKNIQFIIFCTKDIQAKKPTNKKKLEQLQQT